MNLGRIRVATRGSALALAQANRVRNLCNIAFPRLEVRIEIYKTTGDKLQTASLDQSKGNLPKGLFTKELELALLDGRADLAVHSLKDLPTVLPDGLCLAAVPERIDPRDVLIRHMARPEHDGATAFTTADALTAGSAPGIHHLRPGAILATSSTRRRAQLLEARPDLRIVEIRGNVHTRLDKLAADPSLDATVLAAAGLARLGIQIHADGRLLGTGVPEDFLASILEPEIMLPCVGQGALGIETRSDDDRLLAICDALDHPPSHRRATAERAFLAAMGGGCQSPVAAYAEERDTRIRLRAVSFRNGPIVRGEISGPGAAAGPLGVELAARLRSAEVGG